MFLLRMLLRRLNDLWLLAASRADVPVDLVKELMNRGGILH